MSVLYPIFKKKTLGHFVSCYTPIASYSFYSLLLIASSPGFHWNNILEDVSDLFFNNLFWIPTGFKSPRERIPGATIINYMYVSSCYIMASPMDFQYFKMWKKFYIRLIPVAAIKSMYHEQRKHLNFTFQFQIVINSL